LGVPAANAPASSGYQPGAVAVGQHLLSYETESGREALVSNASR
jgi:hypothetical protein